MSAPSITPIMVRRGKGIGGHHFPNAGKTSEWYTPPEVFEALGITFDLDPASPSSGPLPWIPATRFLTPRENGLTAPWLGRVWLNPPYGRETGHWLKRLADHCDGVALVFARTDVAWFHAYAIQADAMCFIEGRLSFFDQAGQRAGHNSGGPSVLLGYGSYCADAVAACGLGFVVNPGSGRLATVTPALPWEEAI